MWFVDYSYIPTQYYESLKLHYGSHSSSLELKLTGTGVDPSVELIPKGDTCDMGHVMATDTTTKTLQVRCLLINHATNVPFFSCQNVFFSLMSKCFFFSYQNVSFSLMSKCFFFSHVKMFLFLLSKCFFFFCEAEESLSIECEVPCTAGKSACLLSQ